MSALFAALTAQERHALAARLLSGSRELIDEKMRLRRCADARGLYGTDADAYVGAIDDVHGVLDDLLAPVLPPDTMAFGKDDPGFWDGEDEPRHLPTGTGWPVT